MTLLCGQCQLADSRVFQNPRKDFRPEGCARPSRSQRRATVDGVAVPGLPGELDSIIGEHGVNLVRHSLEQMLPEFPGGASVTLAA